MRLLRLHHWLMHCKHVRKQQSRIMQGQLPSMHRAAELSVRHLGQLGWGAWAAVQAVLDQGSNVGSHHCGLPVCQVAHLHLHLRKVLSQRISASVWLAGA